MLSLIASVVAGATLATPSVAFAADVCPNGGGWTKVDDTSPHTVAGATAYCFKAGSSNGQGGGCNDYYITDGSGPGDYPQGDDDCNLSHWGYFIGEETETATEASTTEASTTEASTTEASTTEASTTEASTTEASTTEASTTEAPRSYNYRISDPCRNACGDEELTSTVTNEGIAIPSSVDINWNVRYNGNIIKAGSHESGLAVNASFEIKWDAQGDGGYEIRVWLDGDTANRVVERCNLSCTDETPTPPSETETPSAPQSTPEAGVFIPVTGVSDIDGGQSATSYLQSAGFGLLGLGLVLQGISLRADRKKEDK
jgi:hypothetical protein